MGEDGGGEAREEEYEEIEEEAAMAEKEREGLCRRMEE